MSGFRQRAIMLKPQKKVIAGNMKFPAFRKKDYCSLTKLCQENILSQPNGIPSGAKNSAPIDDVLEFPAAARIATARATAPAAAPINKVGVDVLAPLVCTTRLGCTHRAH
jgi:hypothetical protein